MAGRGTYYEEEIRSGYGIPHKKEPSLKEKRERKNLHQKFLRDVVKDKEDNPVSAVNFLIGGIKEGVFTPQQVRPHFLNIVDRIKKQKVTKENVSGQRMLLADILLSGVDKEIIKRKEEKLHFKEFNSLSKDALNEFLREERKKFELKYPKNRRVVQEVLGKYRPGLSPSGDFEKASNTANELWLKGANEMKIAMHLKEKGQTENIAAVLYHIGVIPSKIIRTLNRKRLNLTYEEKISALDNIQEILFRRAQAGKTHPFNEEEKRLEDFNYTSMAGRRGPKT